MQQKTYLNSVNLNRNTDFPYLVLNIVNDNSYPRNPGFQVMHWHEDLQFIYVLSGEIEIVTLETVFLLHPGEGVFINKNVVHLVRQMCPCHYNSFVFPDYFLKFYFASPAGSTVDHVTENKNFPIFHIKGQKENQNVLDTLKKLTDLEQEKTPLYVYEVLTTLCTLWLELCRIVTLPQALSPKNVVEERMTIFLRYIEQHFSEPVSLDALAESAHVSKSECLRCFKSSLQTAPYQYLMEYRLSKAAELLRSTDVPISEIANRVGFLQTSHFGKCFREKLGVSPSKYRKMENSCEDIFDTDKKHNCV